MNVSPHYATIKNRAIALLLQPGGYDDHSAEQIAAWGSKGNRPSRDTIWCAVGQAVTELKTERATSYRKLGFSKANGERLITEIRRGFLEGTMKKFNLGTEGN